MIRTTVSRKGQITIPQVFRKRMPLTGKQEVEVDQLQDGSVIVRPGGAHSRFSRSVTLNRPLLSPQQERRQAPPEHG